METSKRIRGEVAAIICGGIILGLLAFLCFGGCAQNTETPVEQGSAQVTPTKTDQDQATQGSQVNIWVVNAPGKDGLPGPGATVIDATAIDSALTDADSNGAGNGVKGAKAGYVQGGFTINVTTGGTTPSVTGSATGTASQVPSQTVSAYPTQHIDPRISGSVPIGVALPGGQVQQQASAATEGSTANPVNTATMEARYAELKGQLDKMQGLLDRLFPAEEPATQAVTP